MFYIFKRETENWGYDKENPHLDLEDHVEIETWLLCEQTALSKSRLFCSSSSFITIYISHNALLLEASPARKRSHGLSGI